MTVNLTPIPRLLGRFLVVAIALLLALNGVTVYLQVATDVESLQGAGIFVNLFSLDNELAVPAWFASLLLFVAGVTVALLGLLLGHGRRAVRRRWLMLAAVLVFLSADEMAFIHEYLIFPVQRALDLPAFLHFAWVIPYAVLALAVAGLTAKLLIALPARVRWRVLAAGAIFVGGAVAMEMVGGPVAAAGRESSLEYRLIYTVEELAELAGMGLFLHTMVAYLVDLVPEVQLRSAEAPMARPVAPRR